NVKAANGETVPLDNLISIEETSGPPQLFRYNRYVAATISGTISPGYTLAQGVEALRASAGRIPDDRYVTELAGASRDLAESSSSLGFIVSLSFALVFLVLAEQFECFRDPLTILIAVPLALAGALGLLWLLGESLNLFSQ